MKFNGVEHFDLFEDEIIFWAEIHDPPQAIQDAAKKIDHQEYDPKRFGVCIYLGTGTNEFDMITDSDPSTGESRNLYYIDVDGDKHWFQAELPEPLLQEIYAECRQALTEMDGIDGQSTKEKFMSCEHCGEENPHQIENNVCGMTMGGSM